MSDRILDMISSPADLKVLSVEELEILALEIREQIVQTTSRNGGHVAPSLGAVDFILALHSKLNCPKDKIVFDVGHQAYAHKLITGRLGQFDTLRQEGGISGFPKPSESPYDVHPSGHASDSLSVALGLAKARDMRGTDEHIVAVVGDASIAGGMAFEALNQIGQDQTKMIIVLNDNEMSISHNVGALMMHFGSIRASNQYRATRDSLQKIMEQQGVIARSMLNVGRSAKDSMKQLFLTHTMIFEQMGISCTPPIDGNDIRAVRDVLDICLETNGPVLIHLVTKKGKGYEPAVRAPEKFHGISPFDIRTGQTKGTPSKAPKYMNVFGEALVKEAEKDQDIVAITAAMKDGTGLAPFASRFPKRFVDVGIAEGHAVGLACGLATGGKKPVVAIYSTFLQRAIDQMIIDVALPNLNVVFCVDRAGLVGDDGPTHNGMFDLSYSRMIPHMRVLAPSDEAELVHALHTAIALDGPFLIRYPRGEGQGVPLPDEPQVLPVGVSRVVREGDQAAILAVGNLVNQAVMAAYLLAEEGISARVVDMRWAKPLDRQAIVEAAATGYVITVEEGVISGGVGQGVLSVLAEEGLSPRCLTLGLPDEFVPQGKVPSLLSHLGLDGQGIADHVKKLMGDAHAV